MHKRSEGRTIYLFESNFKEVEELLNHWLASLVAEEAEVFLKSVRQF